jgi:hypothetical protein
MTGAGQNSAITLIRKAFGGGGAARIPMELTLSRLGVAQK